MSTPSEPVNQDRTFSIGPDRVKRLPPYCLPESIVDVPEASGGRTYRSGMGNERCPQDLSSRNRLGRPRPENHGYSEARAVELAPEVASKFQHYGPSRPGAEVVVCLGSKKVLS